jgi:uncharacterized protein (DUF4415 family)
MVDRGDYMPTRPDAPELELEEDFWRNARVVVPPGKKSVHLRVDADVLAWFKAQGRGYLTRMNAVLRSYMEAHEHERQVGGAAGSSSTPPRRASSPRGRS